MRHRWSRHGPSCRRLRGGTRQGPRRSADRRTRRGQRCARRSPERSATRPHAVGRCAEASRAGAPSSHSHGQARTSRHSADCGGRGGASSAVGSGRRPRCGARRAAWPCPAGARDAGMLPGRGASAHAGVNWNAPVAARSRLVCFRRLRRRASHAWRGGRDGGAVGNGGLRRTCKPGLLRRTRSTCFSRASRVDRRSKLCHRGQAPHPSRVGAGPVADERVNPAAVGAPCVPRQRCSTAPGGGDRLTSDPSRGRRRAAWSRGRPGDVSRRTV